MATVGPSIGDLFARVKLEARAYALAEVDVLRATAAGKVARYRTGAILLAVAALVALLALIGLVLGLILTLASVIGPGLATLAVVGGLLAIAALLAWIGVRSFGR